jgi:hypothetical protein
MNPLLDCIALFTKNSTQNKKVMSNKIRSMSFAKTLAFSLLSILSCMYVLAHFKYTLVGVISAQGLVSGVGLCYPSN